MSTKTPSSSAKLPHGTSIDIPAEAREKLVGILNQQLANVSDLYSQTKQAHWNVRGPEFYQLHKLFDDLAEPLEEPIDIIAERAVTLGGVALGTVRCAAKASELAEFSLAPGAMEYAKELAQRFATVANSVRKSIDDADELGDADTADLLTQLSRELDKSVYFLEAHFRS
ncbi:MAG: DNA starvation/stationary phase protection protein Dps [Chthoniobacteraceae bacterium]